MGRSTSCSRYSVWPPWQGSDSALTFGKIASATYKVNSTGRPCSPRRRTGGSRRHVTGRPTGCIPCSKPRGASILVGCALCAVQRGEGFRPSDGGNRVVTTKFWSATGPDSGCPAWSCVKAEARLCGLSDLDLLVSNFHQNSVGKACAIVSHPPQPTHANAYFIRAR
jgi:hypothetical protein